MTPDSLYPTDSAGFTGDRQTTPEKWSLTIGQFQRAGSLSFQGDRLARFSFCPDILLCLGTSAGSLMSQVVSVHLRNARARIDELGITCATFARLIGLSAS